MSNKPTALSFGRFKLDLVHRSLSCEGAPIRVGSRALDLLISLTTQPGQVLSYSDLESAAWGSAVVEETNLRVHISALRKTLGDVPGQARFIANIPGRGYSFVEKVSFSTGPDVGDSVEAFNGELGQLPAVQPHLIGRSDALGDLRKCVAAKRLVTVAAPGGMGKTSVAVAVARDCDFPHGVRFVDLSLLTQPGRVSAAVASALGASSNQGTPTQCLVSALRGKHALLVLDNCEHVLDSVAEMVHALLRGTGAVHILTTSREPLNLPGELVYWLEPLRCNVDPASSSPLASPAAQLFAERAALVEDGFKLQPDNIAAVERLCALLDGMPLAVELAAARIGGLGIGGLVSRIDHMFQILNKGRRTAPIRQQTLRALLDWSFDLLSHQEQAVLRRLSVFCGRFSMKDAGTVAAWEAVGPTDVTRSIISLTAKSLVVLDGDESPKQYRLLSTTRKYANEALHRSDDWFSSITKHSELLIAKLTSAESELDSVDNESTNALLRKCVALLDDLRASLEWHFAPRGDTRLGIQVAVAARRLISQLGLGDDFRHSMTHANEAALTLQPPDPLLELRAMLAVYSSAGLSPMSEMQCGRSIEHMLELAAEVGTRRDKLASFYWVLCAKLGSGEFADVVAYSEAARVEAGSADAPAAVFLADRFAAQGINGLGRHREAASLAQKVLDHPTRKPYFQYIGPISRHVSMRVLLARVAWIQGRVDEALELSLAALDMARRSSPIAVSHALVLGCVPIAVWRGEKVAAKAFVDELTANAEKHCHAYWVSWARVCEMALADGLPRGALDGMETGLTKMEADLGASLSPLLVTDEAVQRAISGKSGWCAPEVLRIEAMRLHASGADGVEATMSKLRTAHDLAKSQGAVSWQLRAALSLTQLNGAARYRQSHLELLQPALRGVSGGRKTADVVAGHEALALSALGESVQ